MRKAFVIFLAILVTGIMFRVIFYQGYLRLNYPSYSRFPVQGIDVSHHQGYIEWDAVDKQQVHFAYIKATEGGDFRDKRFNENWDNAGKNGIIVGAYHFFTFCKSGEEQALNFISIVPVEENTLPPAIDLEYGGNCKTSKNKEEIYRDIEVMEQMLFAHYGKKPVLYATKEFYNDFLTGKFPDNPIWYRNIYKKPVLNDKRKWIFWQYANKAHLQGIETFVDLNAFAGSIEEFKLLLRNK